MSPTYRWNEKNIIFFIKVKFKFICNNFKNAQNISQKLTLFKLIPTLNNNLIFIVFPSRALGNASSPNHSFPLNVYRKEFGHGEMYTRGTEIIFADAI